MVPMQAPQPSCRHLITCRELIKITSHYQSGNHLLTSIQSISMQLLPKIVPEILQREKLWPFESLRFYDNLSLINHLFFTELKLK